MSDAAGPRERFLRDRFDRNLRQSLRLVNPTMVDSMYLLTGVGTILLLVAPTPTVTAAVFVVYVLALAVLLVVERRRVGRAAAQLDAVLAEDGPDPERELTKDLPRYLLSPKDAPDVIVLDAIIAPGGDSLSDLDQRARALRRRMVHLQLHLVEVTLCGLALVPPIVALRDVAAYSRVERRARDRVASLAVDALRRMPPGDVPFADGRAVRYRNGAYVVELPRSRAQRNADTNSFRATSGTFPFAEGWLVVAVLISTVAFLLHPISGILVS